MVDIGDLKSPRRKSVWVRVPPSALVSSMDYQYGPKVTTLPLGFVPYQQWPEYGFEFDAAPGLRSKKVGTHPTGARRSIGPLCVEEYVSDIEPDLSQSDTDHSAPGRMVVWRRLVRTDKPKGWHVFSKRPSRVEGFLEIASTGEYWKSWSKIARHERTLWRAHMSEGSYAIKEISWEDFSAGYTHSTVAQKIGLDLLNATGKKWSARPEHITFWGAYNTQKNILIAGIATVQSPQHEGSYYQCGFMTAHASETFAMIGLIDHWCTFAQEKNLRFLQLGRFWTRGESSTWKGFSLFKSKFRPAMIAYPPVLLRFKR